RGCAGVQLGGGRREEEAVGGVGVDGLAVVVHDEEAPAGLLVVGAGEDGAEPAGPAFLRPQPRRHADSPRTSAPEPAEVHRQDLQQKSRPRRPTGPRGRKKGGGKFPACRRVPVTASSRRGRAASSWSAWR